MEQTAVQPLVVVERVSKRFGVTQALDEVSASFLAGEVHALMGENGAGKSTLGKVIAGLHKQDGGSVAVGGHVLRPGSIDDAYSHGVRIVHQELAQCPNLSVAENLCLHDMPRGAFGLVDRRAMNERAARLVHMLEPGIDVTRPLGELSPGWRQICQIAAALERRGDGHASDPRVIVFDEPTSSLSIAEVERLLRIVRDLAARGLTILYVSHRMGEIFACCDRVTVLRDGKYVATSRVSEIDEPTLVEQMIGRRVTTPSSRAVTNGRGEHGAAAETGLRVSSLSSPGKLDGVSLSVRPGEIVGVGGLVGAGRSELLDAIFGLDAASRGAVEVAGSPLQPHNPRASIKAGMGYVPEDRKIQGLFFLLGIDENIVAPVMGLLASSGGIRRRREEGRLVGERMRSFQVKAASPAALPGSLSGGNQQKLLLARWMGEQTRVLLLDEPTRGIDVGTKAEIYRLIRDAAASGVAVLLVSSEMPELLHLSDRVLVMSEGRITGDLSGDQMTQANILRLATMESHNPVSTAP
ncbi:MAG: sugar ABC transporter ATP-binding protein [Phycisphaeraceae bacterium]|nr:sugar ABC transporter ATP-binding protein [Phycisphaeraceae bacterium]